MLDFNFMRAEDASKMALKAMNDDITKFCRHIEDAIEDFANRGRFSVTVSWHGYRKKLNEDQLLEAEREILRALRRQGYDARPRVYFDGDRAIAVSWGDD